MPKIRCLLLRKAYCIPQKTSEFFLLIKKKQINGTKILTLGAITFMGAVSAIILAVASAVHFEALPGVVARERAVLDLADWSKMLERVWSLFA